MYFKLTPEFRDIKDEKIVKKLINLNNLMLDETYKGNKVAYYYEDLNNNIFSYNEDICFYAASSIKILVCLYLFELASKNKIDLNKKVLVTLSDIKQGTGIICNNKDDKFYTIEELIKLSLVESDNTAYIKLMELVGKDKLKEYGNNLGAIHTMKGKETDCFGLVNCKDMILYWKKIIKFINEEEYGKILKKYLINPSTKIIDMVSINDEEYIRKYGSFDIAFHEAGYVNGKKPYYLIILTQLNNIDYKYDFVNNIAKQICDINNYLSKGE